MRSIDKVDGFRFPIRLKILLALLLVVTVVVSLITFTMAGLFHDDKKAYITDLTSLVTIGTAEECRSLMTGYENNLRVYSRIAMRAGLQSKKRGELFKEVFEEFEDLVAVSLLLDGEEIGSIYDSKVLESAGIRPEELMAELRSMPLESMADGETMVSNSTRSEALPVLTMAVVHESESGSRVVVTGLIRLNRLLGLASRSSVFDVYVFDRTGTLLAHSDPARVAHRERMEIPEKVSDLDASHSAGITIELERDGQPMIAGFSRVRFGGLTVGASIPRSAAYLAAQDLLESLVYVALGLLSLAALLSIFGARRLTRPIERLVGATREIAKGEFETMIDVGANDEIGSLAGSFNDMARGLKEREEALQDAQEQLVQSEKLAAFGQLGAGIAHEVKNPLAGILGCAQISLRKADRESPIYQNLLLIEKETKRCRAIIENLLKFARQEKASLGPTNVNESIRDAIAIVHHQLELQQVKLEEDLSEDLPPVFGNANQLQQVLMNLLMNAQQAMEGKPGRITLSTRPLGRERVEIRVSDNGPGMSREVQEKIFEPFFTTKPGGRGTGLGLSVSFGIIKDHGGEILLESSQGEGTTFVILLSVFTQEIEKTASATQIL